MKILHLILVFFCSITLSAQNGYKGIHFKTKKMSGDYLELNKIESYFSYVPAQTYQMGDKCVTVNGFFMLRFEVPNMFYKLFIEDLESQGKTDDLKTAFPDTNIWFSGLSPYSQYYYQHPAYNSYPVLGVSRDGVNLFCQWLEEKIKTLPLKDWKNKKIKVRLPSEAEWMIAAAGDLPRTVFAWEGPYMRMAEGKYRGDYMANFCHVDESQVTRDADGNFLANTVPSFTGNLGSTEIYITAPVISYWQNGYGLYNMCGNVREMVQEEGFTKGGGWIDPGGELRIEARNTFQKEGFPCEGFRVMVEVE